MKQFLLLIQNQSPNTTAAHISASPGYAAITSVPQPLPPVLMADSGAAGFIISLALSLIPFIINLFSRDKQETHKNREAIAAALAKAKLEQSNQASKPTPTPSPTPPPTPVKPILPIAHQPSPLPAPILVPLATPLAQPTLPSPAPAKPTKTLTQKLLPAVATKKTDWSAFQQLLKQHNITRLYHFTDRENLASIRAAGGLLSWYSCKQNDIAIPRPGGNETSWQLDSNKGLADYVRLAFVRDHPMMYIAKRDGRLKSPVLLEIDPDVIFLQETKFSLMNAAKNGVSATGDLERFSGLKFEVFRKSYFDLSEVDKPYYQAEVLIYRMLPANYILNLDRLPV